MRCVLNIFGGLNRNIMAMKCELCGKGPHFGNVISHANNTRRRRWNPNLRRVSAEGQEPSQEEALSLKLNVLDELINNEILLERAKKLNLEASDGEVEDKFTELKSPYTEDEFQRQLKDRGVSADDLKRDLRRQLSITKLMNREVVAKIAITDQDVAEVYNTNKAQFNVAEPQYRIAQIVVTPKK